MTDSHHSELNAETPSQGNEGMVIVMNGFPGTGKYTILQHLYAQMSKLSTMREIRLIDNHVLIDPAASVFPDRGPEHHELRRRIRNTVFASLRQVAINGCIVLMTACLAENEADCQVLKEHLDIVRGTAIPMVWINAHCDQDILEQRATSTERIQGTKTKLTDRDTLRKLVDENKLIQPTKCGSKLDLGVSNFEWEPWT